MAPADTAGALFVSLGGGEPPLNPPEPEGIANDQCVQRRPTAGTERSRR